MGCPIPLPSGVFPVKRLLQQRVSTEITEVGTFREAVPRSGLTIPSPVWPGLRGDLAKEGKAKPEVKQQEQALRK